MPRKQVSAYGFDPPPVAGSRAAVSVIEFSLRYLPVSARFHAAARRRRGQVDHVTPRVRLVGFVCGLFPCLAAPVAVSER